MKVDTADVTGTVGLLSSTAACRTGPIEAEASRCRNSILNREINSTGIDDRIFMIL